MLARIPWFPTDHHLYIRVNCFAVFVLVDRWDEHGDAFLEILLRDVPERLALRVYRPDDLTPLVVEYLDPYGLVCAKAV